MDLTHVLIRRVAALSLACLLCVLLLTVWRAQSDVHREGLGAEQFALLSRQLAALQNAPEAAVDEQIRGLRKLGRMRHLEFRLEEATSGELLARSLAEEAPPAAMGPFFVAAEPHVPPARGDAIELASGT